MEQPSTDDESLPGKPRAPNPPAGSGDVRPQSPSRNPKVTPLDEDEKLKQGIEIKET